MTLRRKLLVLFCSLAALTVIVAGVALFVTLRWQATTGELEEHYARSLLLQQVRAGTFAALKEVDDALTGDSQDAAADFDLSIGPAVEDLTAWARLIDSAAEREQVETVRAGFDRLVLSAREVFALLAAGRRDEAVRLVDERLDTRDYIAFQELTQTAVAADRQRRQTIRAETENLRQTAQIMIAVSILGALSLTLLLAAFLAQDLFRPLRDIREALHALGSGDLRRRLDTSADDEFGAIAASYNRAVEALARDGRPTDPASPVRTDWRDEPSSLTLRRLVADLKGALANARTADDLPGAVARADALAVAVGRLVAIGFPLDLNLAGVDLGALVHDVLAEFRDDLTARGVSCEIALDPETHSIEADRLKLRAVLVEAVRNALAALPERGGRLGLRVTRDPQGNGIRIEIADDGRGMDEAALARLFAGNTPGDAQRSPAGLAISRAIAERHGGSLVVLSEPGRGTVVRIGLPAAPDDSFRA